MSLDRDPGQRILPQREREPLTIIILIGRILPLHRNPTHGSPKWSPPENEIPKKLKLTGQKKRNRHQPK